MTTFRRGLVRRRFNLLNIVVVSGSLMLGLNALADPLIVSDLSGTWTFVPQGGTATSLQVPGGGWYKQGFTTITEADYQRTVTVPNSGQPQIAKLEFGAVNYQADLYINNTFVGTTLTSFTPSCFDITGFVTPGQSCAIRVHVKGRKAFMSGGKSAMPNAAGWSANTPQGIFRSARLAVYPQAYISDVFVRPSVANASLYYDVWITNGSTSSKNLALSGKLTSWNGDSWAYPTIADTPVSVAANSTSKITIGPIAWTSGSNSYWWPNVPYQAGYSAKLHNLNLTLKEGAATRDSQSVRFGFREVAQKSDGTNTCYFLNGIRVNFRGDSLQGADYDSINFGGGFGDAFDTLPGFLSGTNGWPKAVDNYQRLNYNFVRLHQEPVSPYMLDVCDQMGLMVMEETAIRGSNNDQDFSAGHDNMVNHLKALFTRDRNHPSIVRQSLSNEPSFSSTDSPQFELDLYNAAMGVDGTRPLSIDNIGSNFYESMNYGNFSVFSHYGNGIGKYTEKVWARLDRPYGQGEFVWNVDNTFQGFTWFATSAQAMRRQGASDIRPYTLLSAWASFVTGVKTTDMTLEQGGHPLYGVDNLADPWGNSQIKRIQAGYNPVLVADRDYWEANKLSDSAGNWPANDVIVQPNQAMTRTLDIYNDTFNGTAVDVFWELRQDSPTGASMASGQLHPTVALGYMASATINFTIPNAADETAYYLVLYSKKAGAEMFREISERFVVLDQFKLSGVPFGSTPAYHAGNEFDKASDGNLNTFFDYASPDGGVTGIDLGASPSPVSTLTFTPRSGFESRMVGGAFQGSNDGVNYTTIYTVSAAPSPNTTVVINAPSAYRYLRYSGPAGSYCNIAEMAFYTAASNVFKLSGTAFGASPAYQAGREFDKASDGDLGTFYDYLNADGGFAGIDLGAENAQRVRYIRIFPRPAYEARMNGGAFQGSNDGVAYTNLCLISGTPTAGATLAVSDSNAYRFVRYVGPAGSHCNISEMEVYGSFSDLRPLTGAPFGANPPYAAGREYDKASDGNESTFYDYINPSGGYAGIDLGSGHSARVVEVYFTPRPGFESRMVGGVFQGSVDGTNYATLATVAVAPKQGSTLKITDSNPYRYLRYLGPSGSYCDIAEMEFYSAN